MKKMYHWQWRVAHFTLNQRAESADSESLKRYQKGECVSTGENWWELKAH
jgi:hypothetical protein